LRDALLETATLRAVLEFLCAHEPDLVAAAEALGMTPAALAAVREQL
jgi:adenine/guanine phosphoribosyltransferase-like PRPP-binding protein